MSQYTVGFRYPREFAKIRGMNRKGIVELERDPEGIVDWVVRKRPSSGWTLEEIREHRKEAKQLGRWQNKPTS